MKSKLVAFMFGVAATLIGTSDKAFSEASGDPSADRVFVSADGFFFNKDVEQGSEPLPGGANLLLTQVNVQYSMPAYYSGVGLIYQMDKVGRTETDTTIGLKLDIVYSEYYVDFSYGVTSQRFVSRLIGTRSGFQTQVGFGRRSPLQNGRMFFDFSLKHRTTTLTKEDGSSLNDVIIQTELVPLLGLGAWI